MSAIFFFINPGTFPGLTLGVLWGLFAFTATHSTFFFAVALALGIWLTVCICTGAAISIAKDWKLWS